MKNSNKKGFTLVELLVVIAILAILATVAVVGYSSFTEKANISNDTVIAKELTTLVQATDINDPVESFDDVMDVLYANGFYLANLNTKTAGCYFVWESSKNEILLVDGDDNYTVLYPESYTAKGNTWYVITSNKADYDKVSADLADANVNVRFATATISSLKEMIAAGGEQTIYIDDSLVIEGNGQIVVPAGSNITINLNNSLVSGQNTEVLTTASIPFQANGGTATIVGGVLSTYATLLDDDNKPIKTTAAADNGGTLNIIDTLVNAVDDQPLVLYADNQSNITLENVTVTGNSNNTVGVFEGSTALIKDCDIGAVRLCFFISGGNDHPVSVTIDGGTYSATSTRESDGCGATIGMIYEASLVIEDGTFTSSTGDIFRFYAGTQTVTIKGGTFNGIAFDQLTDSDIEGMISELSEKSHTYDIDKNADGHWIITAK